MIFKLREVPVSLGSTEITLRPFGDVHKGSEGHHGRLWMKFLQTQERDKHSYCIGVGDLVDADRPSMRQRKLLSLVDRPEAWTHEDRKDFAFLDKHVVPDYMRIRERCLGLLDGDHFVVFSNGMTSTQYICRKTGIPYLGERMAYVGLSFRTESQVTQVCRYTILARHGRGAGNTAGGDVTGLQRQNAQWLADLYLGGHTHRENAHPVPLLGPNTLFDDLKEKTVWYVRCGSFLRGFMANKQLYPEQEEYGPLCTGWVEIRLTIARLHTHNRVLRVTNSRVTQVVS